VAEKRGLNSTTVHGHLAEVVANGKLSVFEFIDEATLKAIRPVIIRNKGKGLRVVRDELGEKYTYEDLRMATAHIISEQSKKGA
jgi:hypothetical protein